MSENGLKRYSKRSDEVFAMLQKAEQDGKLETTIIEIFSGYEHDMVTIWKCREYFINLPDSFWEKDISLLSYLAIIRAMQGDIQKCKAIVEKMGHTPDELDITKCTPTDIVRLLLELVLPYYSDEEFFRRARFLVENLPHFYGGIAITACRLSVVNGFRDFTCICPQMEENEAELKYAIEKIYGKSGKGVYEVGLAEWNYEIGNTFDALVLIAGTIPTLEGAEDIRCQFVALALQIRILMFNGQHNAIDQLFDEIEKKIYESGFEELEASFHALKCLVNCYYGKNDKVTEWLNNKAPNENKNFFTMDMFSYLVKLRAYIQTKQYMLAVILGKKLIELLKSAYRPHDLCECHMLIAIACLKAGDEKHAMEELEQALIIARDHGYIRLIADEGQAMLDLLKVFTSKSKCTFKNPERFNGKDFGQIKNIAFEVSGRFPKYLGAESQVSLGLTKMEEKVLLLMAEGLSNDDISTRLGKKVGTIKCHTANIYRKFNVENRQQAVNYARKAGLVE